MIRAVFGRDRVTVMGHAGYAPKGQDIVCAAASALVFALIGSLRQEENLREVVIRPGYVTAAAKGRAGRSWSWCGADWRSWRRSIPNA